MRQSEAQKQSGQLAPPRGVRREEWNKMEHFGTPEKISA